MENDDMSTLTDTIVAIATPYGMGGIAVIRMSGPQAKSIATTFLGRELTARVHYCSIPELDDVVVTSFTHPHSFTGEDVVEISCHGSLYIQQEIVRRLIDLGARQARGGEFTQRAFLNGKMDLTQAEAVADIIAAETQAEQRLALNQLRGGISNELKELRERLLRLTSLLELELDFGDHEELEFADRGELQDLAQTIAQHLEQLTQSFTTGNAIKKGIPVAIIGRTNAGKSTLLNALIGEERAIVSSIEGTTRDTIEERLILNGVLFRIIDTAGLRDTEDTIEKLGIERSQRAIEQAQIVLHVIDLTQPEPVLQRDDKCVIPVYNKVDLVPSQTGISAKNGNVDWVKDQLLKQVPQLHSSSATISNARHYEALVRALEAIRRVQTGLTQGLSGEWLSMDLQDCLTALGEITGQITNNEVLGNIFSKFCIGK